MGSPGGGVAKTLGPEDITRLRADRPRRLAFPGRSGQRRCATPVLLSPNTPLMGCGNSRLLANRGRLQALRMPTMLWKRSVFPAKPLSFRSGTKPSWSNRRRPTQKASPGDRPTGRGEECSSKSHPTWACCTLGFRTIFGPPLTAYIPLIWRRAGRQDSGETICGPGTGVPFSCHSDLRRRSPRWADPWSSVQI